MNAKYLAILVLIFGLLFTLAQCGRLSKRSLDDRDDDGDDEGDNDVGGDNGDDDNDDGDDDNDLASKRK
jgi:hypothetical protein